jgi:chromosome segregation ATPase
LSAQARATFQTRLTSLNELNTKFREHTAKLGLIDTMRYILYWDWENTAIHHIKNTPITFDSLRLQLIELQQDMDTAAARHLEMQADMRLLCRDFQGIIDSNRNLSNQVVNLATIVAEQNQKIDNLTAQNQELKAQNQEIKAQNQEIIQMLRGMQPQQSPVSTQASSFVSYTSPNSFITSLD